MSISRRNFIKSSVIGTGLTLLGQQGDVLAQDKKIEKLPEKIGLKEPFSFCAIADPHCSEAPTPYRLFACIEEIEKLKGDEKPDFILILGDVHLWALKKEHLDKITIPLHVISGNHEDHLRKKEMRQLFPNDFKIDSRESDYYSFVHKGVRFIGICDARGGEHIGTFCSEDIGPRGQCEWLEKELAQKEQHKIIFAHIPPEPDGQDIYMFLSRNDSRYFNQLINKTQPTAMFFGHRHIETVQQKIGNTFSITLRSCCWNFHKAPQGFMVVKVTPAGISTREILTATTPVKHSPEKK